ALQLLNAADASLLEKNISNRKRLIYDQNVWIHVDRHRKSKTDEHTARIRLDRPVHELPDLGEFLYLRNTLSRLRIGETKHGCVKIDISAAREERVKAGPSSNNADTRPLTAIPPDVGRITPAIIRKSVLLPDPFSPTIPRQQPRSTETSTSFTAQNG